MDTDLNRAAVWVAIALAICAGCDSGQTTGSPSLDDAYTADGGIVMEGLPADISSGGANAPPDAIDTSMADSGADAECVGAGCPCPEGFESTATGCIDIDECQLDNGGCGDRAQCVNERGSAPSCRCRDGRIDVHGDGSECLGTLAVSLGESHVCAISEDRVVYCWGDNTYGQLGDGTNDSRLQPVRLSMGGYWTAIAAGGHHTCGIRDRTVYCWGSNAVIGQPLGSPNATRPVRVGHDDDWSEIATGDLSACAIARGALYCWGQDVSSTRPGDSPLEIIPVAYEPKMIGGGPSDDWSGISAGRQHFCGFRRGLPICFGAALNPQVVGEGETLDEAFRAVGAVGEWDVISAGHYKVCGIRDGALYCWGQGALGNGVFETLQRPTRVGTDADWKAVVAGSASCGIRGGSVYCWGHLHDSGRADGVRQYALVPTRIGDADDWIAVDAHRGTMCGLRGMGLYCWGDDANGQLGRGIGGSVNVPARVGLTNDYTGVAVGE